MTEVTAQVSISLDGCDACLYDVAAGPCAGCGTWVGADPKATTKLRFRVTYEN